MFQNHVKMFLSRDVNFKRDHINIPTYTMSKDAQPPKDFSLISKEENVHVGGNQALILWSTLNM